MLKSPRALPMALQIVLGSAEASAMFSSSAILEGTIGRYVFVISVSQKKRPARRAGPFGSDYCCLVFGERRAPELVVQAHQAHIDVLSDAVAAESRT